MDEANRQSDGLWDVGDVARYLKVSPGTIRRRIAGGTIPFLRVGKFIRFRRDDIDRWLDSQPQTESAA